MMKKKVTLIKKQRIVHGRNWIEQSTNDSKRS